MFAGLKTYELAAKLTTFVVASLLSLSFYAQTLIVNEVSQGSSGTKEYIEFVVSDTTAPYNCNAAAPPPCIDIRGWIFDDNNGDHGSSGIASGCNRFSYDNRWACVPIGTVILVYNTSDINPNIPATNDTSMNDNNCTIVAPIDDNTLFDNSTITPSGTYPATWNPGGVWTRISMANGSDCVRITDLGGNAVFSLCWGNNTTNPDIYFTGSAQDRNYFLDNSISNNPYDQNNWTNGCADAGVCVTVTETPGSPNNVNNTAWIASLNNNCSATITPLITSFISTNSGCNCTGTASITASGSVGPYTYLWSTAVTGQGTANVSNLCAGNYTCYVTSAIGCIDTLTVNITSAGSLTSTTNTTHTSCNGVCDGTASVTVTSGIAPYTYSWNTLPVQNTQTATNLCAGTYTVTITDSLGCIDTANVTITEPAALNASIGSFTNEACGLSNGTAMVNVSGGTIPYTYSWNTSPVQTTATATGLAAGLYIVTVTDSAGCIDTTSINLTNGSSFTTTINNTTNASCNGMCDGIATAFLSGGVTPYTYSWNTSPIQTTATATNLCAGTYTVTVIDSLGCTDSASVIITEPSIMGVTLTTVDDSCSSSIGEVAAHITGGTTPYTYIWNNSQTTSSIIGLGSGNYHVTVTDSNGCQVSDSVIINSTLPPIADFDVPSVCEGAVSLFTNLSNPNGGTIISTIWTFGDGNTSNQTSPIHQYSNAGSYNVTLLVKSNNGCSSQITKSVDIYPNPIANFSSSNACVNTSTPFTDLSTITSGTITNWDWDFGDGQTATITSPNHTYTADGNYTVTLIVQSNNGCEDTLIQTINVHALPTVDFIADSLSGCAPLCANFAAILMSSVNVASYSWDIEGHTTLNDSTTSYCFTNNGNSHELIDISLTVSSTQGCVSTVTKPNYISLYPQPIADFAYSPYEISEYNPEVIFENLSSNASSAVWNFGDGNISTNWSPIYTYQNPGSFLVDLIVKNSHGCTNQIAKELVIQPEFQVWIPNTFFPFGNRNKVFTVKGFGINTFKMMIFNRWGELIYTTDNMFAGWNGVPNGSNTVAQTGTYVYKIKVSDFNGKEYDYVGQVNLMK